LALGTAKPSLAGGQLELWKPADTMMPVLMGLTIVTHPMIEQRVWSNPSTDLILVIVASSDFDALDAPLQLRDGRIKGLV
jgi:hypothetical protein